MHILLAHYDWASPNQGHYIIVCMLTDVYESCPGKTILSLLL